MSEPVKVSRKIDLEQRILSTLFVEPNYYEDVESVVDENSFSEPIHQKLFHYIKECIEGGIDPLTDLCTGKGLETFTWAELCYTVNIVSECDYLTMKAQYEMNVDYLCKENDTQYETQDIQFQDTVTTFLSYG